MNYEIDPKPHAQAALQRLSVEIEYMDGTKETIEALGRVDLGNPYFLIITTSRNEGMGIACSAVKKWIAKASKLSVVGN